MKKKFKIFCFGFGQVAEYFIKKLIEDNFEFEIVSTNTKQTQIKKFNQINFKSYYFCGKQFDPNLIDELIHSNKVLISIPPRGSNDLVLQSFNKIFKRIKFDWITYLSATSVYGDKGGKRVDENIKPNPTSIRGISRLNAEREWLKYFKEYNLPIQIFRLSGIYSNENNILKRLKAGTLKIAEINNHFFSRIHIEDIASVLSISLTKFNPGQIFNISDNYPSSNTEIAKYASGLIKMQIPKSIAVDEIESEMLRDFYRDSKKISNEKMKSFFKYNLKYPTFKEGLKIIRNHIV